ncbi:hypothetical protein EIP86_004007 [Pleurotus ostreatoroseus]|nr:hypothetical protein EIP86_004007 [Pleurotus ostreatoroseus]
MPGSDSEENTAQDAAQRPGIVVTAPSSPELKPPVNDFRRLTARPPAHDQPAEYTTMSKVGEAQDEDGDVPSRFEQIIESTLLPPSGPAHFAARRALWRRPISFPPPRTEQSAKLRELLDQEGAVDSDEVWNNGLDKIWKGVTSGERLKRRLPMRYLIKILQAGWVRDGTWPRGYTAPEPDDEVTVVEPDVTFELPPAATSSYPSGLTSPTPETTDVSAKQDGHTDEVWLQSPQ